MSRSGDALGGRRPRHHRLCRLGQSDRPVRDEVDEPPREPRRARRSTGPRIDEVHRRQPPKRIVLDMDSSESPPMASGQAAPTTATSAAPVITRCSCSTSSAMSSDARCAGQRAQRHRLARGARAGDCPRPGEHETPLFPGRCRLRQSHELLEIEGIGYTIRPPANRIVSDIC